MAALKRTAISVISLTLFLALTPFAALQNIWCKVILKQDVPVHAGLVYAEVLSSVDDALKILLSKAVTVEEDVKQLSEEQMRSIEEKARVHFHPGDTGSFLFYVGKSGDEITGYAVRDAVNGKWGPIYYMMAISPKGKIDDVLVLEYQEKRGRPVAKRRFLKQFRGKSIHNKIKLMSDIRGVTGASISSGGMANGIRKMIYVFNEVYGVQ